MKLTTTTIARNYGHLVCTIHQSKKVGPLPKFLFKRPDNTGTDSDIPSQLRVLLSSARRQVQNIQSEIHKLTEIIISETEKMISTACEVVRRISHDLMPDALVNFGLPEAVRDLAMQIEFDHGLSTAVDI